MGLSTAIRDPINDLSNHTTVLKQLKEAVEIGQRLRGSAGNSYVQASELLNGGLWKMVNGVLTPVNSAGSGGGGAVSITGVNGITVTPSPLTGTGTVGITSTAVAPGSYTNTNLTVNSQGQITAASNGSGGGAAANITPDTHPAIPTAWDDEFEFGTTLDTTGARFAGANAWTLLHFGTPSPVVSNGALNLGPPATAGNLTYAAQAVPAGSSWQFTAKTSAGNTGSQAFLNVRNSVSNAEEIIGIVPGSYVLVQRQTNNYTTGASSFNSALYSTVPQSNFMAWWDWVYIRMTYTGTTMVYSVSKSGVSGTFVTVVTSTMSTFLGTPTHIGLYTPQTTPSSAVTDWFRRTA